MTTNNRQSPVACVERPERFYHATGATLRVGDVVLPGREVGRGRGHYVWMSAAPATSWGVNVYEVEPIGDVYEARSWYRAGSARVVADVGNPCGCAYDERLCYFRACAAHTVRFDSEDARLRSADALGDETFSPFG